ncbi:hypothetical protein GW17_00056760 [Ensete ventricosum]|uniref:ADP/ATP translocase n=1 Tax=Ensete ventricosum TaxID=4639 RepID=A0A426XBJ5_ENSVE|nr:hypothetical protein B296_00042154 [Ensete ventricosum]RWV81791.1 hypothetical protein GW17_00056760 [Ensete ventricosum]
MLFVIQDNFLLGWGITFGAGLASYPFDTVRRRMMMMMTSGRSCQVAQLIRCLLADNKE